MVINCSREGSFQEASSGMISDVVNGLQQGRLPSWALHLLIATATLLFAAALLSINAVNGWWNDELYALWASDPTTPFTTVFAERIYPDTNPPLYFSALYLARLLAGDDRVAILLLNVCFMVAAGAAVLLVSHRARLAGLAAVGITAFALSGPALVYAVEGRAYLAALAVAFVAAWCVALAVEEPDSRPGLPAFVALGTLGALTHVYAALFCGALAAGLLVVTLWVPSRRELVGPALALGLSASFVLGVWLLTITSSLGRVDWMEFSLSAIAAAAWYVKEITVKSRVLGVLLVALISLGLFHKRTRPLVVVFSIAFGLFIVLPLIISLKKPMITGRYWVIGAPGLIVLLSFLARAWLFEMAGRGIANWPSLAFLGVVALACASSISGFLTARNFVASKPVWKGAEIVRPLLGGCPTASVHIGIGKIEGGGAPIYSFAQLGMTSPAVFVDAGAASAGHLPIAAARCPVLGWAEHVLLGDDFPSLAPDAELLRVLKIDAAPDEIEIRRHKSGFVLLKRP
jgi:hypothetical protein